jgi:TonB-linked SusC/RagA family outer membrane protein
MKTFNELTKCVLVGACLLLSIVVNAQIKGKVLSSEDNTPLPGVSIIVKGTSKGAISDSDGQFSLDAKTGDALVVSFVGYKTLEVNATNDLSIQLLGDSQALSEVVVTALGISREKKSLGYAVQNVKGDELTTARENNLVSSLAGKVAGLTVVNNASGIGGSARVTIRGERSLNINKNQPLFVIDGVPISNEVNGNSGRSYQDVDYGNGAAMVNADDVETVTVLKGASASALYGSRANNGVILITTKSGKNSKGFGISYNQNVTYESALKLPEYQNTYGQGVVRFGFVDGNGGGLADGTDENWGPRMSGQLLPQAESPRTSGLRGGDTKSFLKGDTILYTPFSARPDNVKDFFETGRNITTSVALSGSNDKGDLRLSFTNIDATGIVPNTDLNRSTLTFNGGYNLTPRFKVNTNISYVNSKSNNRPNLSYGTENIMYLFNCWLGRQVDLDVHREYWQRGLEGTQQFNFNYNYHDNPYFGLYENTNGQKVNRVFGNVRLSYDFTDWLSLQLRGGTDVNNEFRPRRRAFSTQRFKFGSYREEKVQFEETNLDFLFRVNKNITPDITFNATFGGNQMRQNRDELDVTAPQLLIPGIYSLNNTRVELQSDQFRSERRINSVYGSASFGYKGIYLDLTARNDWSSTLPTDNNSYFYPSVNVSAVLSDMVKLPTIISYAKIRGGFAQVGGDTNPFQLTTPYNAGTPYGTFRTFGESGRLVNPELRPEISTSFEMGTEWRFLGNRIGLDLTYYNTTTKDQILAIPLSNTSGYDSRVINAGKVNNWGVEAMINLVPVKTKDFTWSIDLNFSANRSKVLELTPGIKNFVLASRYVTVEARVGERMGEMYGIGYQRVNDANSPFNGQIINASTGRPTATTERIALGNYNPDWLAGVNNTLRFKNIALSFLFDIRQGGKIYSHTQTVGREGGMLVETLEGRRNETDGYNLALEGNGVIAPGVIKNADGTFKPNDVKLSAREWHTAITGGRSIIEGMMYDASFVKLREARLSYTLPNSWFGSTSLRDVSLSLVGRNLLLFANVPHIDPENASTADGTIIPGVESVSIPSTRSMGVNLSLKF